MRRHGVGDTFRFTELSTRRLVRTIGPLLGAGPARRAALLAQRLLEENGASAAATVVERTAAGPGV
ncbi:hypothetical protein [Virgisporangium aliadipatigenens]|uniref:hypothetical protein n=1 Tax=Virgisporangium aliadipatigenens TaxID=741659 RepID=UPI00194443E7|nr:hypothetical protein [Virgisporangium aliadipatigenens]